MPEADILEPSDAPPADAALSRSWWPAAMRLGLSDLTVGELLVKRATASAERLAIVSDQHASEVVVAAVQLRSPLADPHIQPTTVCRERLAPYEVPVRFEVVSDDPMPSSGTVRTLRLREQLQGG